MRSVATISVANNYIRIFDFGDGFENLVLRKYCKMELTKYGQEPIPGTRKKRWVPTHVFARTSNDRSEYRMPKSVLEPLLRLAASQGFNRARIQIEDEPVIEGAHAEFSIKEKYSTPRENQKEWIEYKMGPGPLKVNEASTGLGKTYMALYCMMLMQKRTIITIQPRYIPIWQKDLAEMFNITPKDVLVWEYTDLPRLGELCKEGKIDPKIIILPTTRISTYMRSRRKDGNLPCLDEIIANINPGLRIIDEAHESFHEVTLSMFYGNVAKTFMLSATLKGDDPFLNKMYQAMAPKETRLKEAEPENYIDIFAYLYQMDIRKHKIQTMQGGTYNDIALEKSILRSKEATDFYFQLADDIYKRYYLDAKEEGTKCIFFFTLIEMCLVMKEKFREKYPGEDFDTFLGTLDKKTPKKYLEHENLITTPGSCGTGKDIPGAITCISFHTVFSIQRNKQMIGRLRNLLGKFGGRITPRFIFPVCVDIAKHGDCYHKRKLAFAPKQKSWKTITSGLALQ